MTSQYEILKHHILEQILNGELVKGQKLPTESEMMAAFSVSRYTVRRAISDLENDHYVYRVQGGGSYVCRRLASQAEAGQGAECDWDFVDPCGVVYFPSDY